MELSKRMQAVASLITIGYQVADIGTDHAYIPISLIGESIAPHVIAMDVRKGPLDIAKAHIQEQNMQDKIETRLSNGFEKLRPGEVDAAVIAGMGGELVIRILEQDWSVTSTLKELILQPQSELAKVRAYLLDKGFQFVEEDMVLDEGKYYPMMKVVPPAFAKEPEPEWTEEEIAFGRLLLQKKNEVLYQFLEREKRIRMEILASLAEKNSEKIEQRKVQLQKELDIIEKGLDAY